MIIFLGLAFLIILFISTFILAHLLITRKWVLNHKRLATVAKWFYNYFYSIKGINHLSINNYGYSPIDEDVSLYPPIFQSGVQLYNEVVKNHAGYIISPRKTIVEIGCGKGAGAAFLIKKFNPVKYTGIDYSLKAIQYCVDNYMEIEEVEFICGDAHQLPLANESTDVVINVESSHIYKDLYKFFKEVNRVLKKDGKFLFTDYRYIKHCPINELEKEISGSGFKILNKRDITKNIYDSCIHTSKYRGDLINEASPWYLKKYFGHYSGLIGSKKLRQFGNGEIVYFIYHLEKAN